MNDKPKKLAPFTVRIPDELHIALIQKAKSEGRLIQFLVAEAIKKYLNQDTK